MNSRGRLKRDPGPQDLLSVAKNCLDLLMRPDEELCPGRYASAAATRGGKHHKRKKGERKGGEEEMSKALHHLLVPWTTDLPGNSRMELLAFG